MGSGIRFAALRFILILPLALCLALIILVDSAAYRALLIAALVVIEGIRDASAISSYSGFIASFPKPDKKPAAKAKPIGRKQK